MLEIIIIILVFWGGAWLIGKLIEWIEKKREAIRDRVADEVLVDIDIEKQINKYKAKLNHINYMRNEPIREVLRYYAVREHGSYVDFFSDLGHCPKCKEGNLLVRVGGYGKFIGCSKYPKCKYTKNIKVAKSQYREGINKQIIKDIQNAYS